MEIGDRLRSVRLSIGLSQRALAKQAGVTNATVSLIESGKLNPSFGVLKRIADSIPMDLSDFFGFEAQEADQAFFGPEDFKELRSGGILYRQVGGNLANRSLQMMHERYEPGSDTGKVLLKHEGEEAGLIIEGRLEVWVGTAKRTLKPGEAYAFPSSVPHRFRNPFESACIVVSACTPPSF